MNKEELAEALQAPFPADHIEWRVQQAGEKNGTPWARVLAYITNRAIMERLDHVFGPTGWRNAYTTGPGGGVLCGIGVLCEGEWVTKWDGAQNTDMESVKGGLSGAMKRAAVQWGIGRYLYDLDAGFANIHANGSHYQPEDRKNNRWPAFKWDPPALPVWALPSKDDSAVVGTTDPRVLKSDIIGAMTVLGDKISKEDREKINKQVEKNDTENMRKALMWLRGQQLEKA